MRNGDPMGEAIAEYQRTGKAERLRVFSPLFEEDEIPVATLFRREKEMPPIERAALNLVSGRTLDVGAAAGCHSLILQQRGIDVTAIDISALSVKTMTERGVKRAFMQDFFEVTEQFDTILMMMNGIGIVGSTERLTEFFGRLDRILTPKGQVLCDSSDLRYIFENEQGEIEPPYPDRYYGEVTFHMQYRDVIGPTFNWLYLDRNTLSLHASAHGFNVEIVALGDHYDYLARITRR